MASKEALHEANSRLIARHAPPPLLSPRASGRCALRRSLRLLAPHGNASSYYPRRRHMRASILQMHRRRIRDARCAGEGRHRCPSARIDSRIRDDARDAGAAPSHARAWCAHARSALIGCSRARHARTRSSAASGPAESACPRAWQLAHTRPPSPLADARACVCQGCHAVTAVTSSCAVIALTMPARQGPSGEGLERPRLASPPCADVADAPRRRGRGALTGWAAAGSSKADSELVAAGPRRLSHVRRAGGAPARQRRSRVTDCDRAQSELQTRGGRHGRDT